MSSKPCSLDMSVRVVFTWVNKSYQCQTDCGKGINAKWQNGINFNNTERGNDNWTTIRHKWTVISDIFWDSTSQGAFQELLDCFSTSKAWCKYLSYELRNKLKKYRRNFLCCFLLNNFCLLFLKLQGIHLICYSKFTSMSSCVT